MVLMFILVTLSTAGGLSGAGSNIPLMLIFFEMDMEQAIPVSNFVGVCSTLFRFLFNFHERHPTRPERSTINYEIVMIVMPAIFFGSMVGGILFDLTNQETKMLLFGSTVAWSIHTTIKKARALIAQEAKDSEKKVMENNMGEPFIKLDGSEDGKAKEGGVNESSLPDIPELREIRYEEANHLTCKKYSFISICFAALFVTQSLYGSKNAKPLVELPEAARQGVLVVFGALMLGLTAYMVRKVKDI